MKLSLLSITALFVLTFDALALAQEISQEEWNRRGEECDRIAELLEEIDSAWERAGCEELAEQTPECTSMLQRKIELIPSYNDVCSIFWDGPG
jgi:hypothetical protein